MNKYCKYLFPCLALITLSAAAWLSISLMLPSATNPVDSPPETFSAHRAMQDLQFIAREAHPMGANQAHVRVRDYLVGEIRALGLQPEVQKTMGVREVEAGWVIAGAVENILVRLPGADPSGALLLMSHYDSAPGAPGAVDSGSGVVTILEILRALTAGPALRQDVIVLFTDGEEPGTIGAHAFAAQHTWIQEVRMVINLEQFRVGPPMLLRTSRENGTWVSSLSHSVSHPGFTALPFHLFPGGETDLVPFSQAGIAGADFQTTAGYPENHTALDKPGLVDLASLQQAGDQILALVRDLANQESMGIEEVEETFFPLLGWLVHYPTRWAIPLAVLASLCLVGTIIFGLQVRVLSWPGISLGLVTVVLSLVLSVGVTYLIWQGLLALHPEYAPSVFREHLSEDYLYAFGFGALVLALVLFTITLVRRKISSADLAAGALLFWLPASIGASALVPMTSYLVSWALLVGTIALLVSVSTHSRRSAAVWAGLGYLVSGILATLLWVPVVYFAYLGSGLPLLSLMVCVMALWLAAMYPILDQISLPKRWIFPAAALFVGVGFLSAAHVWVGRDSPPPLINPTGYWLDRDENEAWWIAFTDELDERQGGLLLGAQQQPYQEIFAHAPPYTVQASEAPVLDNIGPSLEVIESDVSGESRVIRVRVVTSMNDRLYVIIPGEAKVSAITIPPNQKKQLLPTEGSFVLRVDGMPVEGIEIEIELNNLESFKISLVEERSGLPLFPGLSTEPLPGTMRSPGEFIQAIPTDFSAISRDFRVEE